MRLRWERLKAQRGPAWFTKVGEYCLTVRPVWPAQYELTVHRDGRRVSAEHYRTAETAKRWAKGWVRAAYGDTAPAGAKEE